MGGRWSLLLAIVLLAVCSAQAAASPTDFARTGDGAQKQCSDGIDNDGDGKIDHPADPGCGSPNDNSEQDDPPPACSDGADNDGDGAVDAADPGCSSSTDNDETDPPPPPACSDGADNDGDGKVDSGADPGCSSSTDNDETDPPPPPAACSDGADNDGDGKVDFDADPGCSSASDDSEFNPTIEQPSPPCSDGADNDGDGKVDFGADPGCSSASDESEFNPTIEQASQPAGGTLGVVVASPRPRLLAPFPIVRLQGRLKPSGVRVTRLQVRAPRGSVVLVRCRGRNCPVSRVRRVAGGRYRRFRRLERFLESGTILRIYVTKPGFVGKYTQFRVRPAKAPTRRDACLMPGSESPTSCPTG